MSVGEGYAFDLVMCVDKTGSMTSFVDDLKSKIDELNDFFWYETDSNNVVICQFRIKIIAFGDYATDKTPVIESEFFVMPNEINELKSFLDGIEVGGGGDIPENALEAIALAMKSDWTTDGDKRRHFIHLFTDAPPLNLSERAGYPGYPEGMPKDFAELMDWWQGEKDSYNSTYQPNVSRLVLTVPRCNGWEQFEDYVTDESASPKALSIYYLKSDVLSAFNHYLTIIEMF